MLHSRNYEIALTSWIAPFDDPISLLERYRSPLCPKNFSAWDSKEYQNLFQELEKSFSKEERKMLFDQAERLIAADLPIAPLYHWNSLTLAKPRVEMGIVTPSGGIRFETFSVTPE